MGIEDARQRWLIDFYSNEIAERAGRFLTEQRLSRLTAFVTNCRDLQLRSVVEVGAGAGRDGQIIAEAGMAYIGVDLTPASVEHCHLAGLDAVVASATDLPFDRAAFDSCWTMSTLMHLDDVEFSLALKEIRRVVRPGGIVEVGVWGHTDGLERTDEHGRFFRQVSDDDLVASLGGIGEVIDFETWGHREDGGHYQWARIAR